MSSPARKVHRVPVMEDGKLVGIITQSSIISFLARRLTETVIDKSHDPSVNQLGVGTSPVLSVNWKTHVIDTFRLLAAQGRSGVALVDGNDRLVGTTTNKDVGYFIQHPTVQILQSEIFEYLK